MRSGFGSKWLLLAGMLALFPATLTLMEGCTESSNVPLRPPDTTPPATISLMIDEISDSTVTLSWQAPGGDGMTGTAQAYDLRYATFRMNEETWSEATPVSGLPAPGPPRSEERTTIRELTPGTTYFFAIRSRDAVPNWSPISPILDLTQPFETGQPVLWGGKLHPSEGTILSGFIFQVHLRTENEEPLDAAPEILVGSVAYPMRLVSGGTSGDALYEFDLRLEAGTYDYYFRYADGAGNATQLPNPGSWSGPAVEAHQGFGPDFIEVPVGTYQMGSGDPRASELERPQHEVSLAHPFQIDRYEITNAQLCEGLNWAHMRGLIEMEADTLARLAASGDLLLRMVPRNKETSRGIQFSAGAGFTPVPFREDWPATHLTWFCAAFYCNIRNWRSGVDTAYDTDTWENIPSFQPYLTNGWRLPTEAEWEYLARYENDGQYPTGDTPPRAGVDANICGVVGQVTPVGEYPAGAHALGLRDLVGNVWEWCNDWKGKYEAESQTDPPGPRSGDSRVMRGGSWGSPTEELRCAQRFGQPPGRAYDGLGFRCVRSVLETRYPAPPPRASKGMPPTTGLQASTPPAAGLRPNEPGGAHLFLTRSPQGLRIRRD